MLYLVKDSTWNDWIDSLEIISASSIILIIGADGAFNNVWQVLVNEAIASPATSFDIVGLVRYSHDKY